MLPLSPSDILNRLEVYERSSLNFAFPHEIDVVSLLDDHSFTRLRAVAQFWKDHPEELAKRFHDMVVASWSETGTDPLMWVVAGTAQNVNVFAALGNLAETRTRLVGLLPGLEMSPLGYSGLGTELSRHFRWKALLHGIPGIVEPQVPTFDRIVRMMRGMTWGIAVHAVGCSRQHLLVQREKLLEDLSLVASASRFSRQMNEQQSKKKGDLKSETTSLTVSEELTNWYARRTLETLEFELMRKEQALAEGSWEVQVVLGADSPTVLHNLMSTVTSCFRAQPEQRGEPISACECKEGGNSPEQFLTYLTSKELAQLTQIPAEETPGFAIRNYAVFDTDFEPGHESCVELGAILQDGTPTNLYYSLPQNDLAKHCLIVGVTGSGKSTSVMTMLEHISSQGIPFSVIEPAKTEYRGWVASGFPGLQILTLGNENVSPFRLNPFEFETGDEPGMTSVLSHIDYLKAVFNAAFVLYAPMPYVLDIALHEIYEERGWDLASSHNRLIPNKNWRDRTKYPIFPTLSDLYHKIDQVVARLRYDQRLEQDIRASLKTRIASLRLGSKGLMLDVARGIPANQLFSRPVVFELDRIGNDDEKTFLMGLLLVKLFAYRRLQALSGALPSELQHLIVIEEAHRLLQNTVTQVGMETANPRAMAVETFVNMLSEMRAYRQGAIIAEQIPSKLVPDVIKNTNLKVVHRLVAQDDRETTGATMNLTTEQTEYLATLRPGMAAVFAERMDHSHLIQVKRSTASGKGMEVTDKQVATASKGKVDLSGCLAYPDWQSYGINATPFKAPLAATYHLGRSLVDAFGSETITKLILLAIFNRVKLRDELDKAQQQILTQLLAFPVDTSQEAIAWFFVLGVGGEVLNRTFERGWSFPVAEQLGQRLTRGLLMTLSTHDETEATRVLDDFVRNYERNLLRKQGLFPGCEKCSAPCIYQPEVSRLAKRADLERIRSTMRDPSHTTQLTRFQAIAVAARNVARNWLKGEPDDLNGIAYCVSLHVAASFADTDYDQREFAHQIAGHFEL